MLSMGKGYGHKEVRKKPTMTNKADGTIPIEYKISGHGQNSNRYHSLTIGGKVDSFHPLESLFQT